MSNWFVVVSARNWVASVSHQGKRVLELEQYIRFIDSRENIFAEWRPNPLDTPDFSNIEDHFFITAAHKSVEWLNEALKRELVPEGLITPFLRASEHVKVVRDIREHHLKYINGGGWQRDKDVATVEIDGIDGACQIDASSVMTTDEGRIIGGRVNVQKIMQEADNLYPALTQILQSLPGD
ncbi:MULTISPECIES: hypothetical protein [unclassified Pseudomonas]|uniref:hypothetical protein n=1 Tax=unclassified Pseudomonas TaxID=196821 RepID=UPI000480EC84|nr:MULTISPECIES: hypothetical protein [unclassified Pseudomonas]PXX72031.1 hypothetical protein D906_00006 [Pseudomonas sp. LAIL14HWK12:I1]SOC95069.1 hypothetical protein SAMN05660198_00006 [Pseudomonas sp. LAIL14HWK12:I3]